MRRFLMPARDIIASPWLLLAAVSLVIGTGTWLALWLNPEPHSDWGYYWAAAGAPGIYERGGAGLWLLAVPKMLGLPPVASALLLNSASAGALAYVLSKLDCTVWRIPTWLATGYLLLIAPYLGIVQLDLLAAALLALGLWHVARYDKPSIARGIAGIVLIACGVSTKPQFALVLWAMTGLAVPFLLVRRPGGPMWTLLAVLLAGALAGFALDNTLRSVSGRTEAIRTNSAVTLYGGLLVSGTGQGCGYWSPQAAEAAKADLGEPLSSAVMRRLAQHPPSHWAAVVRCKLPQILRPPPYALYWLVESPNVRQWIDMQPNHERLEQRYQLALRLERKAYGTLTITLMLMAAGFFVLQQRRNAHLVARWFPILWIVAHWLVHAVFEIQGRYFLGMYLLLPVLCLIAWRSGPKQPAAAADRPPQR